MVCMYDIVDMYVRYSIVHTISYRIYGKYHTYHMYGTEEQLLLCNVVVSLVDIFLKVLASLPFVVSSSPVPIVET